MPLGGFLGGLGGLGGNIAILAGAAGKGGKEELKEALQLAYRIQEPDFDFRELSPPQLQLVAEYHPDVYEAVVPDEVKTIIEPPGGREAQLAALQGLGRWTQEDLPLGERLAGEEQQRRLQAAQRGAQESVLTEMARRGRLGAGEELSARVGAGQQGANLAAQMGSDLTQQAIGARLTALQALGGQAGAMRGQDIGVAASNADIVNRFNQYVSGQLTQAAADAAAARNQGQLYNVGTRQRLSEEQAMLGGDYERRNQEYLNQMRQARFGNQLAKYGAVSGALGDLSRAKYYEQAAKAQAIRGIGQGAGQATGGLLGAGLG